MRVYKPKETIFLAKITFDFFRLPRIKINGTLGFDFCVTLVIIVPPINLKGNRVKKLDLLIQITHSHISVTVTHKFNYVRHLRIMLYLSNGDFCHDFCHKQKSRVAWQDKGLLRN